MLIYHSLNTTSKNSNVLRNNKGKKKYKSVNNRKPPVIQAKAVGVASQKKRKKSQKKITNKNIKFLEGLGLKVKQ